jgi:citrate lyase subunit beta/citryl-CoA lyase
MTTGADPTTRPDLTVRSSPPVAGSAAASHHHLTARSLLFVPGNRPNRFAKAAATAADLVIADLEDAVPEDEKTAARDFVTRWLSAGGRSAVRVNDTRSVHYQHDVAAVAGLPGLRAVVVPMADDPTALAALHQRLGPGVEIVALIETALGVVRAVELASTPGVSRLAFGHLDFAADIGSSIEDQAMLMARSTLVVASRAAGLPGPVDGVTTALDDPALSGADAARARSLGFTGKLCIHPNQVEPVNAAFSPCEEEIAWARRIIEASTARGASRVDGHMVDAPIIRTAQSILARAKERT